MKIPQTIRNSAAWLFGWLRGRTGAVAAVTLLSLLWFVADWCMDTTFRALSDWMLYAVNISAALLLMAPYMLSRRVWLQILVLVLADGVLMANLMYNRTYLTAIPAASYALASNMADFTASITDSLRWQDLGFALILIGGSAWMYRTRVRPVTRPVLRWLSLTALFILVSAGGILCRGGFYTAYDRLIQDCYYYTCGTPTYTVAGSVVYNIMDENRATRLSPEARAEVLRWKAEHRRMQVLPPDSLAARRSLVLIFCESLESWPVGAKIDGRPVTPYLDSLVTDSTTLYAPHVLTQVGPGHSIDAQLLYTCGLLPTVNGVYSMKYYDRDYPSLNKALKRDRGARSIMLTADKLFTWNQGQIARSFGYDSVLWRKDWKMDELILRKLSDGSFLRQAVDVLRRGSLWPEGEPGMMTVVTYTGHAPFKLNDELADPDFPVDRAGFPDRLHDYIRVTHYVDSQLRTLIEYLRGRSDYGDMLVVIVGDHEGLGRDRAKLRRSSAEAARLVSPGRYTPMIILNAPQGGRYEPVMGQVDVYTTLLDMLGLRDTPWRGMGQSILDPGKPRFAITSQTRELDGDTVGTDPAVLAHYRRALPLSETIIIHDLLP